MKTFVKVLVFIVASIAIIIFFTFLKMQLHSQGIYIATSWIGFGAISILFYIFFLLPKKNKENNKDEDIKLNKK
jgi:hypothetical protein